MKHPIEMVEWVDASCLNANDYNPNVVMNKELELLSFSLLTNGWIQPILVSRDNTIIDGYHRWFLSMNDKRVRAMTNGKVPVVKLDIDEAERKLLTIRINRAKGVHQAFKMHEIIASLVNQHGLSIDHICKSIGADRAEIELLLKENVFKVLDIENHKYSKAWVAAEKPCTP